jgi:hypothetical protein
MPMARRRCAKTVPANDRPPSQGWRTSHSIFSLKDKVLRRSVETTE